ncbi:MAG TPA: hypothetical protein DCS66_01630 [Flavobacteriaceae bacterium]|nr:hypothetical protein [Flavobacteriaceae bacterium]
MGNYRQYANLVTAAQVVANVFTNENTDEYLISDDVVVITELTHLKPVLSLEFYEELKLQNNNGTLTVANLELMTYYLQPALEWLVRFEVINEVQNNSSSQGIVHNLSDFANSLTPPQLSDYVQDTYRKARVMLNDMTEFLNHNDQSGNYPTYKKYKKYTNQTWKNHGIIMYDSCNDYCGSRGYASWKFNPLCSSC